MLNLEVKFNTQTFRDSEHSTIARQLPDYCRKLISHGMIDVDLPDYCRGKGSNMEKRELLMSIAKTEVIPILAKYFGIDKHEVKDYIEGSFEKMVLPREVIICNWKYHPSNEAPKSATGDLISYVNNQE